mmetsp:Transcript_18797/g.49111  ORF Transcript_18797/g.49111 Transcript_18797/m.49111 type:complete len:277 (-) Transcript_18797:37-867(-)
MSSWTCDKCTYVHSDAEAQFLCCAICSAPKLAEAAPASAPAEPAAAPPAPTPATRPARENGAVPPRPRPQPVLRPPPAKRHRAAARKSSVYLVPSEAEFEKIKDRFPRARKALAALKWGGLLHATMLRFDDIDGAHRDLERIANDASAAGVRVLNGRAFRLPAQCWDNRGGVASLARPGDMGAVLEAMLGVLREALPTMRRGAFRVHRLRDIHITLPGYSDKSELIGAVDAWDLALVETSSAKDLRVVRRWPLVSAPEPPRPSAEELRAARLARLA